MKLVNDLVMLALVVPDGSDLSTESKNTLFVYVLLNIAFSSFFTSAYCFLRLVSTGREAMVLEPIYGASGILVSIAMYSWKRYGNKAILEFNPLLTYGNASLWMIISLLACWLFRYRWLALDTPFALCSILFSWSYLRFYIPNDDGSYGTPGKDFSFVTMFPEMLHVVLVPLTTGFYNACALLGVFPTLSAEEEGYLPHYYPVHQLRCAAACLHVQLTPSLFVEVNIA